MEKSKGLISEKEKELYHCVTCKRLHIQYMMIQLCNTYKIKECIKCYNRKEKNGRQNDIRAILPE